MKEKDIARFWSYVEKASGCWEWKGGLGKVDRYGMFHFGKAKPNRRTLKAHRVSYELEYGPIPKELLVLHKCDNRRCVRPSHLFVGTQADNMHDMIRKGRSGLAKLAAREIDHIRLLLAHTDLKQREIGELYGVTQSTVSLIKHGKVWHTLPVETHEQLPV